MEVVRVSSATIAQALDVLDAAIVPPGRERDARAVRDELTYLLGVAHGRRRVGPTLFFACLPAEERT